MVVEFMLFKGCGCIFKEGECGDLKEMLGVMCVF